MYNNKALITNYGFFEQGKIVPSYNIYLCVSGNFVLTLHAFKL